MPTFPNLPQQSYVQTGFSNLQWGVPNNIAFSGSIVNAFSNEGLTIDAGLGIDKLTLDSNGYALANTVGDLRYKCNCKGYINLPTVVSGSNVSAYEIQLLPSMTFSVTSSMYQGEFICKTFVYDTVNNDQAKFTLTGEVYQLIPLSTLTS